MRKKIFATLMSVAMVASFMPSLAFAAVTNEANASKDWLDVAHHYLASSSVSNSNVKTWVNDNDTKEQVVDYKYATCTEDGYVVLKCNATSSQGACKEEKKFEIPASHSYADADVTIEQYVAAMKEAKATCFENEAQAAVQLKNIKETNCSPTVKVSKCTVCGKIDTTKTTGTYGPKEHTKPAGTQDCATSYVCSNCHQTVKVKKPSNHTLPDDLSKDFKKTGAKVCGTDVEEREYKCTKCGEAVKVLVNIKSNTEAEPACTDFTKKVTVLKGKDGGFYLADGTMVQDNAGKVQPGYIASKTFADTFYASDVTVNGKYGFTCAKCGHVTVSDDNAAEVKAPCEHKWETVTKEATCTTDKQVAAVCTVCCKYTTTAEVKHANPELKDKFADAATTVNGTAKGHDLQAEAVKATCEVPAHYVISCKTCGKKYTGIKYYEFDKDKDAKSVYLNSADGSVRSGSPMLKDFELKYLDPTVAHHKMSKDRVVLKEADCEVGQLMGYKCETCGKLDVHNPVVTPNTVVGHKPTKVNEHAATCGTKGTYMVQCEVCKKYANKEKYDVNDSTDWDKNEHEFTSAPAVVGDHAKCDFSKWVVVKDSTVFDEGVKELHCAKCGAVDGSKAPVAKKTVAKATVTLKAGKNSFTVKASAANATGYKVVYKRAGKKAITKVVDADKLAKTYKKLAKGKKYTVKVTAFASNGTDTVYGATTTKTVKTK